MFCVKNVNIIYNECLPLKELTWDLFQNFQSHRVELEPYNIWLYHYNIYNPPSLCTLQHQQYNLIIQ